MTAAPAIKRVDPLLAFQARCEARAILWNAGEFADLAEAVDILWHDAERDGLVDELGQGEVQRIIAAAFAPFRECEP